MNFINRIIFSQFISRRKYHFSILDKIISQLRASSLAVLLQILEILYGGMRTNNKSLFSCFGEGMGGGTWPSEYFQTAYY